MASAYKMTSTIALYAVTRIIPIHLLTEERAILYETNEVNEVMRDATRSHTIERWQKEWTETTENRAQTLMGHGCFMKDLNRIQKTDSNVCIYYPEIDNAKHTLFECTI